MIPDYTIADLGYYDLKYNDGDGALFIPDWDGTLYWEFRDSSGTLRFTATTSSDPVLIQNSDGEGPFVSLTNLDLSAYEIGLVTVKAYAKRLGEEIPPYPFDSIPFRIIEPVEGYCAPSTVIIHTGVVYSDLSLTNESELTTVLNKWIKEVSDLIDEYCETSWEVGSQPKGIRRASIMMVAEIVGMAQQRRKTTIIKVNEYSIKILHDIILTDEVIKLLDLYKVSGAVIIDDGDVNSGLGIGTLSTEDVDEINEENEWPPKA